MKKILLIAILIVSVFIQACASISGRWEYRSDRATTVKRGGCYIKDYQLGKKQSAFIGQSIINLKVYDETIPIALPKDNATVAARYKTSKVILYIYNVRNYPLRETITVGEKYYLLDPLDKSFEKWMLLISTDGRISEKSLFSSYYSMLYTPDKDISIEPMDYKLSLGEMCAEPLFSYQIIYSGINDVSLNMTYKEYTKDDLARPAFFQNLTYNADAKQIRFKDFLIQLQDVTNEKITYTILEDGIK